MIKTRNFHKEFRKIVKSIIYLKVTYHKNCLQWIVSSMKKYNKNLEDTLDYIVEKRNIVNINNTFVEELKKTNNNN